MTGTTSGGIATGAQATIPVFGAEQTAAALPFAALIGALRDAFAAGAKVPLRHHHSIPQPDGTEATLLLMPAWQDNGGAMGVKVVSVFPGNAAKGLPGLYSTYLLCDGATGQPQALIDGNQITGRRTVGVAALGASYLARPDASRLLVVGAGRIGSLSPFAFREVRPIDRIEVWDRDRRFSETLVATLTAQGLTATVADDLETAARRADIISCATLSTEPLIRYDWLRPGTHLDLIGSFTPAMREADDTCMASGSVYIDSPDALEESGDLIGPIAAALLSDEDIRGTLSDLCSGRVAGRRSAEEITVFKAVGTGLSDLAAGALAYRTLRTA